MGFSIEQLRAIGRNIPQENTPQKRSDWLFYVALATLRIDLIGFIGLALLFICAGIYLVSPGLGQLLPDDYSWLCYPLSCGLICIAITGLYHVMLRAGRQSADDIGRYSLPLSQTNAPLLIHDLKLFCSKLQTPLPAFVRLADASDFTWRVTSVPGKAWKFEWWLLLGARQLTTLPLAEAQTRLIKNLGYLASGQSRTDIALYQALVYLRCPPALPSGKHKRRLRAVCYGIVAGWLERAAVRNLKSQAALAERIADRFTTELDFMTPSQLATAWFADFHAMVSPAESARDLTAARIQSTENACFDQNRSEQLADGPYSPAEAAIDELSELAPRGEGVCQSAVLSEDYAEPSTTAIASPKNLLVTLQGKFSAPWQKMQSATGSVLPALLRKQPGPEADLHPPALPDMAKPDIAEDAKSANSKQIFTGPPATFENPVEPSALLNWPELRQSSLKRSSQTASPAVIPPAVPAQEEMCVPQPEVSACPDTTAIICHEPAGFADFAGVADAKAVITPSVEGHDLSGQAAISGRDAMAEHAYRFVDADAPELQAHSFSAGEFLLIEPRIKNHPNYDNACPPVAEATPLSQEPAQLPEPVIARHSPDTQESNSDAAVPDITAGDARRDALFVENMHFDEDAGGPDFQKVHALLHQAHTALEAKDYDSAEQLGLQARAMQPASAGARLAIGSARVGRNELDGINDLFRSVELDPRMGRFAFPAVTEFLRKHPDTDQTDDYRRHLADLSESASVAAAEREKSPGLREAFVPASLTPIAEACITSSLQANSDILSAAIVRRATHHWRDLPAYVVAIKLRAGWSGATDADEKSTAARLQQTLSTISFFGSACVVLPSNASEHMISLRIYNTRGAYRYKQRRWRKGKSA